MDLCERVVEAEDLCKRLRRTEQKAVRQQIAIEQPTQVAATVSQLMSEAVLPDMEQDGAQAMQDKGKSSDDQVVAQLQESAGANGLIIEPVAGSGQEQSTVTESSSSKDLVQPWPEKSLLYTSVSAACPFLRGVTLVPQGCGKIEPRPSPMADCRHGWWSPAR